MAYCYFFCFLLCSQVLFFIFGSGNLKKKQSNKKSFPSITIFVIQVLEISKSMSKSSICLASFWYTCRLHFVFSLILFIYLTSWAENMIIPFYSVLHPFILFITLLLWNHTSSGKRSWYKTPAAVISKYIPIHMEKTSFSSRVSAFINSFSSKLHIFVPPFYYNS